jgi:membrane protein YqaA with SNARE-associated domain
LAGEIGPQSTVPLAALSRRVFGDWERFASGRGGTALMFTWAAAESTIWPVIPDFLLLPMSAAQRRRPHIPLLATILGSALGGTAWQVWSFFAPEAALRALRKVPFVRADQILAVQVRIGRTGTRALLAQPWSGIGLKVWAPVAQVGGVPAGRALLAFTAARALRMGLVTAVTALLARIFRGWLEVLAVPLAAMYLVVFFPIWWRLATRMYPNEAS